MSAVHPCAQIGVAVQSVTLTRPRESHGHRRSEVKTRGGIPWRINLRAPRVVVLIYRNRGISWVKGSIPVLKLAPQRRGEEDKREGLQLK